MSNTKTTKTPKTLAQKLAAAQRPEDRLMIHLPGPLRAEWNRVKEEFDQVKARSVGSGMLNGDPKEKQLAKQLAELETEMRDNSIEVTVRALRRQRTPATPEGETTWSELMRAHPPRKGADGKPNPEDSMGFSWETFPEALIRASIVDPVMTAAEWDLLLYEVITERQFDDLFQKAWRLNRTEVDVPFSHAASKTLTSGTPSRRRNGSASPANASKAGSQPK